MTNDILADNEKEIYHLSNLESSPLAQEDSCDGDSDVIEVDLCVTTWTVLESENTAK